MTDTTNTASKKDEETTTEEDFKTGYDIGKKIAENENGVEEKKKED